MKKTTPSGTRRALAAIHDFTDRIRQLTDFNHGISHALQAFGGETQAIEHRTAESLFFASLQVFGIRRNDFVSAGDEALGTAVQPAELLLSVHSRQICGRLAGVSGDGVYVCGQVVHGEPEK